MQVSVFPQLAAFQRSLHYCVVVHANFGMLGVLLQGSFCRKNQLAGLRAKNYCQIIRNAGDGALARQLTALAWPELRVQMAVLPGLDHGGAMLPGLTDALALAQQAR